MDPCSEQRRRSLRGMPRVGFPRFRDALTRRNAAACQTRAPLAVRFGHMNTAIIRRPKAVSARTHELATLRVVNARLVKEVARLEIDREILKRSSGLLYAGKRMRFAFIAAEKKHFPVRSLCALLGVSRSGYGAYARRAPSSRTRDDAALLAEVRRIYDDSRGTYGSPRVHAELRRRGRRVGKTRVERCMRVIGLAARPTKRFRRTTQADATHAKAPNILARDFTATRPHERWVCDITYVWTAEGWCYVAIVLDLFSRAVVGWSIGAEITTAVPLRALRNALDGRGGRAPLLHHSDQGCQYTSREYQGVLEGEGIVVSMSRRGNCYDNAVAESFFSTLKLELVDRHHWDRRNDLRVALIDYIEVFYNRVRLHSTLAYRTPMEVAHNFASEATNEGAQCPT